MSKPTSAHTAGRLQIVSIHDQPDGSVKVRLELEGETVEPFAHVYAETRQEAEANAARLALCWEMHEPLVEALQGIERLLPALRKGIASHGTHSDGAIDAYDSARSIISSALAKLTA